MLSRSGHAYLGVLTPYMQVGIRCMFLMHASHDWAREGVDRDLAEHTLQSELNAWELVPPLTQIYARNCCLIRLDILLKLMTVNVGISKLSQQFSFGLGFQSLFFAFTHMCQALL